MTSKRNSRAYMDECPGSHEKGQSKTGATAYRSRRNSRSSGREDSMQAAREAEEGQRAQNGPATAKDAAQSGIPQAAEAEVDALAVASEMAVGPRFPHPPLNGRPANFGVVSPGIYRSSYPKPGDYAYLQGLKLKTVVTLVKKDEMDHELAAFVTNNGINQIIFNMKGTKKEAIPASTMKAILEVVLDRHNYPLMLHCNHGKHRTGCVVAVVRKSAGWDMQSVLDEYCSYAEPKVRECDVEYIRHFHPSSLLSAVDKSSRFTPVQARAFLRALMMSALMMLLWLFSGKQMMAVRDMEAINSQERHHIV